MTTALLALMLSQPFPAAHSHRLEWLRPTCASSFEVAELIRLLARAQQVIEGQEKIIRLDNQLLDMLTTELLELKKKGPQQ